MKAVRELAGKIGWFQTIMATGGLSGYAPFAPGTAGTAAAIPIYLLLVYFGRTPYWLPYITISLALFVIGIQGATNIENATYRKDHGIIVIDEIVGYLVTMFFLPQPLRWQLILSGFFVFRFFDIWKPFPIRTLDMNPNLKGFGVMIDDVLAGVYGNIALQILTRVMLHAG